MKRPEFPGMDPWLEHPALWPDVHNSLITSIRDALVPQVDPLYEVGLETRTMVISSMREPREIRPDLFVGVTDLGTRSGGAATAVKELVAPDAEAEEVEVALDEVEVDEWYLEIRAVGTNQVVTVIEVLSPTNKIAPDGRAEYLAKRRAILASGTSLVEIDLIRAGRPLPLKGHERPSDYRMLVSRSATRPKAILYRSNLRQPLPVVPIPLLPEDKEAQLDLTPVLHDLIDRARYMNRVDYDQPPVPPLRPDDAQWAAEIIKKARESAS